MSWIFDDIYMPWPGVCVRQPIISVDDGTRIRQSWKRLAVYRDASPEAIAEAWSRLTGEDVGPDHEAVKGSLERQAEARRARLGRG
jgi:hypothetical protein